MPSSVTVPSGTDRIPGVPSGIASQIPLPMRLASQLVVRLGHSSVYVAVRSARWPVPEYVVWSPTVKNTSSPSSGCSTNVIGPAVVTQSRSVDRNSQFTVPDSTRGEIDHVWPIGTPNGKAIVFAIWHGALPTSELAMVSLDGGQVTRLGIKAMVAADIIVMASLAQITGTYFFLLMAFLTVGAGLVKYFTGTLPMVSNPPTMAAEGVLELVDEPRLLRRERPDLKIIFISGYAEDSFRKHLAENEDFMFLQKPFDLKEIAAAMKAALQG